MRDIRFLYLAAALLFLTAANARADDIQDLQRLIDDSAIDSAMASDTYAGNDGVIRLTPDRTHILRLKQDAASVIVANPEHASIVLDSPRLLVVMPRNPGATTFTVLNAAGETVTEKTVIVSAVQQQYVRIRRICSSGDRSCVPVAYFYCPDSCYEVSSVRPGNAQIPPMIASKTVSSSDDDEDNGKLPPEELIKAYGEGVGKGLKQEKTEAEMKAYGEGVGQGIGKSMAPPPSSTNQNLNKEEK
jgi:hypothetical protein